MPSKPAGSSQPPAFVREFRDAAPYINAFRGRTFIVVFGGEAVQDAQFAALVHDLALLNSLGIRLVLVHGARPQIEARLKVRGADLQYVNGLRITDDEALTCVKEAAGSVRVEIEALLSMGLANSPMAGACIRVASGNAVIARPLGVVDGVDYQHTGEVRRIDSTALRAQLDQGSVVLLSPLGYSPTGEVFNLSAEDVASSAAIALQADKVLYLVEGPGLRDSRRQLVRQLSSEEAAQVLSSRRKLPDEMQRVLASAVNLCQNEVKRVHLIPRHVDGALLQELFTRDGIGTLISADRYEGTRRASIDDVAGILELIAPLEDAGLLVRRSRERLETEIDRFTVVERDGMIIACAALYPLSDTAAELACVAVHAEYRGQGRGDALLQYLERLAADRNIQQLFVLSTRAAHWFRERGFTAAEPRALPGRRQAMYNYRRNSKVFVKSLQ